MISSRRHFVVLAIALAGCAHASSPTASGGPVRLQLREVGGTDALVLDGEVHSVRVVRDPEREGIALSVELDTAARPLVVAFTGKHVGGRVEIMVAGRSVATLLVRDPVDVPSLLLTAQNDDEVRRMARDLGARPPR